MKKFSEFVDDKINEKSLSRVWKHMQEHDTGVITGYRTTKWKVKDGKEIPELSNENYTKRENQQRNRKLQAMIATNRYEMTSVKGSFIENYGEADAIEVNEHAFFVVDADDKGKLENDLRKWGEVFGQDSIMFIPKGADKAILWGTNIIKRKVFPGYKNSKEYNIRKLGYKGQFFTKVGNSPFTFEMLDEEYCLPQGYLGRCACATIAEQKWQNINDLP